MSPVYKFSNVGGFLTKNLYTSALAGNPAVILDQGSIYPLGAFTLASAQANVEFTNIPQTYTHLQIRSLSQTSRATFGVDSLRFQFNADTASNYSWHHLRGDGSSPEASSGTSLGYMEVQRILGTTTGNSYGGFVMDILYYRDTNKFTTVRTVGGVDVNGTVGGIGGAAVFASGNWRNNNAVTSIKLYGDAASFAANSSFALYGIRAE